MVGSMGSRNTSGGSPQRRVSILKLLRDFPDFVPSSKTSAPTSASNELERRRTQCREWASRLGRDHGKTIAVQFTCLALDALAGECGSDLRLADRLPRQALSLEKDAIDSARSIGREAASLPLVEALHFVTSLYPALLPDETRSKLGAYYTPPALANRLAQLLTEHGTDWSTARVLDPAAGAGAFLIQAASRMRAALGGAEPGFVLRQLGARLQGMEIDSNACLLAQGALEILLSDLIRNAGQPAPHFVRVCDSLEEAADERFDVVLGNPPYGRVSLTSDQRARYARSLYGHANLYGLFTDLALRWTKPGGLIAYLTPTSFLAGQYYSALRRLLAAEAPPLSIDFVHARKGVFEDVLQETLLAVYRKCGSARRARIHYLNVGSAAEATVTKNGTIGLPATPSNPWLAPRTPAHGRLIARAEQMPSRLRDWGYSVSTGPLVWNRFKSQLTDQAIGPSVRPLIWAECVLPEGRFEYRARKRQHTPFFRLKPSDTWLIVTQPCVLVQRTTAKEQPRRLVAAELPAEFIQKHSGVVVENHLNMVWPNEASDIPPAVVAALLNSEVVDQLFRCINGSVAVSAFELESLPLPGAGKIAGLEELVRKCAERADVEAECARLYNEVDG
jgi:adenine-specific DNA-methyltransferase